LPDYLDAFCPTTFDDDPRRDRLRQQVEIAALDKLRHTGNRTGRVAGLISGGDVVISNGVNCADEPTY
jgi:hypothetical protein